MKTLWQNSRSFTADPRFYDRLNAVCTLLLVAGAIALAILANSPTVGPKPGEGVYGSIDRSAAQVSPAPDAPAVATLDASNG